jgi:hypothetical protein
MQRIPPQIGCFSNPRECIAPDGSLSNRKPLRKTASLLRTHLPSRAHSKYSAHVRGALNQIICGRFPCEILLAQILFLQCLSTERKIVHQRVRMEGWRQRRLGSNARNHREEKEKQT